MNLQVRQCSVNTASWLVIVLKNCVVLCVPSYSSIVVFSIPYFRGKHPGSISSVADLFFLVLPTAHGLLAVMFVYIEALADFAPPLHVYFCIFIPFDYEVIREKAFIAAYRPGLFQSQAFFLATPTH